MQQALTSMPETMVHSRMCMLLPREIALTTCALHMRRGNGPLAEARVLFVSLRLRSGREEGEKRQSVFPHGQADGLVLGRAETNGRPGPDAGTVHDRP